MHKRLRTTIPRLIRALNGSDGSATREPRHSGRETRVQAPLGPANRTGSSSPARSTSRPQTAIVASDLHYGEHEPAALACLYGAIRIVRPDVFVADGDMLEMDSANAHDNKRRGGQRRADDMKAAIRDEAGVGLRELVRPLTNALGPDCRKVWIWGNHEDRVRRALERHASEDEIRLADMLKLRELGWEYDDQQNGHFDLWGIDVQHGDEPCQGGSGMYAARWRAVGYGRDVIFGHTHTAARFSHPRYGAPVRGINNPCLCGIERARVWSGNNRNAWSHGLTVVRKVGNSRPFIDVVEIIDGRCVVDGHLIDGNKAAKSKAA